MVARKFQAKADFCWRRIESHHCNSTAICSQNEQHAIIPDPANDTGWPVNRGAPTYHRKTRKGELNSLAGHWIKVLLNSWQWKATATTWTRAGTILGGAWKPENQSEHQTPSEAQEWKVPKAQCSAGGLHQSMYRNTSLPTGKHSVT